ncbi:MAG: hypothetical protein EFT35_02355 [Methanophagales archaeon ANME-1-THS]|nr:MAG: hypothetical protein EFT35_02355 [Methanophagales archaeon ANME-1-THS]
MKETERAKKVILLLLEQAGPSISGVELKREIQTLFGVSISTAELLWDETLIQRILKTIFEIHQNNLIKEVQERGAQALTKVQAQPLVNFIVRTGLTVVLEECPFEAWLCYQREYELVHQGFRLFLQGDEAGSLNYLEKSVEWYLEALKIRDKAFLEFVDRLATRSPHAYIVTVRGPLHCGIHKELEKQGIEVRSMTVEPFTPDHFLPFELLVSRLYSGARISPHERKEILRREYVVELLMSLIERSVVKSSLKAQIVNQIVKRMDERGLKELLELLALFSASRIFQAPEDPATAVYDWLLEKGMIVEAERQFFEAEAV